MSGTGGGPAPHGKGVQGRRGLLEHGWGLWGRVCARLSSASWGRVALNPQEGTDGVCLPGLRHLLPDGSQWP